MTVSATHDRATSKKAKFALAAAGGVALALIATPVAGAQTTLPLESTAPATIVPGELIVKLRPGTSEQSRDQTLAAVEGVFVRSLDLSDLILARVPVGSEVAAADSLEVDPNVVFAEPNGRLQASAQ
jgi:hypothetical protein